MILGGRDIVGGSGVGEDALAAHVLLLRGVEEALHSAKAALR